MAVFVNDMQRFVVLQHETAEGIHWDLMLEQEDALLTLALPVPFEETPEQRLSSFQCQVVRLPNHRKMYLDYEGPVSRNRGKVEKIDAGMYEQDDRGRFCLQGKMFCGVISFSEPVLHENCNVTNDPITLTYKSMP